MLATKFGFVPDWLKLNHVSERGCLKFVHTQIANTLILTSIRYQSDTFMPDWCLIDVDWKVFGVWVLGLASLVSVQNIIIPPPASTKLKGGSTGFTLSVRLSICGQNHVHSVFATILIGSISYLHILSSNFRRCVACNVCFKIQKFEILANSLNL